MARRPSCSAAARVLYVLLVLMALTMPSITAHPGHDEGAPVMPHEGVTQVEVGSSSSEVVLLVEDEDTDENKALQLLQALPTPIAPKASSTTKGGAVTKLPPKLVPEHTVEDGSRIEDHEAVYAWPLIIGVGVVMGIALLTIGLGYILNKTWKAPSDKGSVGKDKKIVPGQGISTRPTFSSP